MGFIMEMTQNGVRRRPATPAVHNLDLALEYRKQFLDTQGMGRQAVAELQSRLRQASQVAKDRWQTHTRETQNKIGRYISCLLHTRERSQTPAVKRVRLCKKQPASPESTLALPWFTGILLDQAESRETVQLNVCSYSGGVRRLQLLLRAEVQRYLEVPQLSLGDVQPGVPLDNSVRQRKSTSKRRAPRALAAKGPLRYRQELGS